MAQLSAPPPYLSPPATRLYDNTVSFKFNYNPTYRALTLSLPRLGPPTHHRPTSTRPCEPRATCLLPTGYSGCTLCKCTCVSKCVPPFTFFSQCLGCGDLYGVLVTPCVISISVMSISIAWGDWGVVSQMVQCQGPRVWFETMESLVLIPSPKSCHLALWHRWGAIPPHTGVKAEPVSRLVSPRDQRSV